MPKPKTLYKYEAFSTQSLQNLKSQSIYFSPPSGFNDPYDCSLDAIIKDISNEDAESFRCYYLLDSRLPIDHKEKLRNANVEQLKSSITRTIRQAINEVKCAILGSYGVSCFSECNDDLLMWGHYSDSYKGFCLAFSTDDAVFEKVMPVKYTSTIPMIDSLPIIVDRNFDQWFDLFCTKSDKWVYEKEWRLIHKSVGEYTYLANTLKAVYFGSDMDVQSIEIVCLILAGQNLNVELYRGVRSTKEFKITFEKFTYTSFVDIPKD